ncbi:hypothetical protein Phi13:1_gp070 [Cellulophaga phage phi13:1]|uniref:Uncharacterized protein n=1 Tax=Cellulophaga phage phi13:1 TaxID=1327992 RepID=S0A144_9CAUD|nr:hypothetical protein Phi13:1_gp070 [Cellulophaga phage phi13:1]
MSKINEQLSEAQQRDLLEKDLLEIGLEGTSEDLDPNQLEIDFQDLCGYSEEDARFAAHNVSLYDHQ